MSDINIDMVHSATLLSLTFTEKKQLHTRFISFYFLSNKKFLFSPGQYLQIIVPHSDVDERGSSRFFTIASSPNETCLIITTTKGRSSYKKALFGLMPGDHVQAFGPMGTFVLEQ